MAKTKRLLKSFIRLLLPLVLLLVVAFGAASIWLLHETSHPAYLGYLVTPEKYGQLSSRGAQVTDETWNGRDGNAHRGWLLRGAADAPAVILLHRYGADRSHVLNMGVKLNEATNFTVLMPDQRGHGKEPAVKYTTFGGGEGGDAAAAIEYVRTLKSPEQFPLVGKQVGIYGLELGALAALAAAVGNDSVTAIALDSVPTDSDAMVSWVIGRRFPFARVVTEKLGQIGTYAYFYEGNYNRIPACEMARKLENRNVLLLAGADAQRLQDSTSKLSKCFPASTKMDSKTDLSPSGMSILNASIELSEGYDQRVIDFFRTSLLPQ